MAAQETKPKDIRIFRYSWWQSSDGTREFVVVDMIYGSGKSGPEFLRIVEKFKPIPYEVSAKEWIESVRYGQLKQLVWQKDEIAAMSKPMD